MAEKILERAELAVVDVAALVEVSRLRPAVEAWLAERESGEEAFLELAAASGLSADAWRRRLSDDPQRGWWRLEAIDERDADELLTAMGRPDLWQEVAPPVAGRVSHKVRLPGERGRIKRHSKAALLTRAQVEAAHKLHIDGGLSMREIARRGWEQWGYASAKSCLNSLCDLMESYGLKRRDRIAATVAASTTHGRGSRGEKAAYKRWYRREHGFWPSDKRPGEQPQPLCAGVRLQYPRKGEPCSRPAMLGSEFCISHDPACAVEREANLERARGMAA